MEKKDFKELLMFEENDRSRSEFKNDFKNLQKVHKNGVQFRDLIDYFLKSSS